MAMDTRGIGEKNPYVMEHCRLPDEILIHHEPPAPYALEGFCRHTPAMDAQQLAQLLIAAIPAAIYSFYIHILIITAGLRLSAIGALLASAAEASGH